MWGKIITGTKKAYGAYKTGKAIDEARKAEEKTVFARSPLKTIIVASMVFLLFLVFPLFMMSSPETTSLMQGVDPFANSNQGNSSSTSPATSNSAIVNCAREQLGKPYVWGAEGPNSFDCSGLVTYCYRKVLNVEIPHFTGSQIVDPSFQTVSSVDGLGAGDIILDGGSTPSHVGIYSGEGTVIHAPTFNDIVREVPLDEFYGWVSGNETFRHYIGS